MNNRDFFDMKAKEAGFNLRSERDLVDCLYAVVIEALFWMEEYDEDELEGSFYDICPSEKCLIVHSLDADEDVFRTAYLLNQFGLKLRYSHTGGGHRIYIKE